MVNQIYPAELQLNKDNSSDMEVPFLDLNLSISNGSVSTKCFNKREDFDFDIVKFPFLDGDILKQGYRYHKLRKALSKFYCRHSGMVEEYNVSCSKVYRDQI